MLLRLSQVIDPQQLQVIVQALRDATFVDGKLTAGAHARRVKSNQELEPSSETAGYLQKIVMGNLYNHPQFRSAALPHRVAAPLFAKYGPQMTYGEHIDDPVMGEGQRFRCDVAVTVFLNQPDEYEGGELVVRTAFGEQAVKLGGGDGVLYPASSLHRVNPVTKGERLVAVTWVQSLIRDPARREILYELGQARDALMAAAPDGAQTAQVGHAYTNLVRMWAEV